MVLNIKKIGDTNMRKNKTYEQQKKFYDKNNDYESLGALFFEWLTSGYMTAKQMQNVYREGTKECKEYILEDLYHLCELRTFYKFIRIFNFGNK